MKTLMIIINWINAAVLAGTPLLLATNGEILTEKSGTSTSVSKDRCIWVPSRTCRRVAYGAMVRSRRHYSAHRGSRLCLPYGMYQRD